VITTAYLVGAAPPSRDIAGLPILLRQTLSLQDAGITDLVLVGVVDRSTLDDRRVRLRVHDASAMNPEVSGAALVSAVGCVWPQALVRRLVEMSIADDELRHAGDREGAIYVCGRLQTLRVVTEIANAGLKPCATTVTLQPREFVTLPRSQREIDAAVAMLLQSLYKPTDGLIARSLDRHVSLAITTRLLSTRVTPNQMTFVATLIGALGIVVVSRGGYGNVLAGTALFEAQGILDGCDGEIARIKYLHSRAGEWFDQVADDVLNIALLASVGAVLAADGYRYAWPLTKVAVVAQAIFAVALYAGLVKTGGGGSVARLRWWIDGPPAPSSSRPDRSSDRFWRFIVSTFGDLTRRDFMSFFYLVSAVAGWMHAAFIWQAAVTIGSAVATSVQWLACGGPALQSSRR
jgi:phosphatidylglycerophosphate synthase